MRISPSCVLEWVRKHPVLSVLGVVVASFVVWGAISVTGQVQARSRSDREAAAARRELIAKNDRVLECQTPTGTPNTPPGPHTCYDDTQRRTGDLLSRAAVLVGVESDCRFRRATAGLPSPDPRRPCSEQTPPEVFPGGG